MLHRALRGYLDNHYAFSGVSGFIMEFHDYFKARQRFSGTSGPTWRLDAPTSVVSIFCYKQPSPCHFKYPKFTYSTHILYTHTHTLSLVLIFCWSFKGISRSFSRPVIQKAIFFYSVFCNILSVLQELTILPRLFTVNFIHTHTNTRSGALQFVNTTDSVDLTPQLLDLVEVI